MIMFIRISRLIAEINIFAILASIKIANSLVKITIKLMLIWIKRSRNI